MSSDTRLTRHFRLSEVACKCGSCETTVDLIDSHLMYRLQGLRDAFGLPLHINSGYRCRAHNDAINGSVNSQHLYGKAVDISTKNLSGAEKYRLLQLIMRLGTFTGVGIAKTFIHVDVRDTDNPIIWTY